jgi:predicted small metal-binding protein
MAETQYLVECDCGWSCRGNEDEVVAACREHGRDVHGLEPDREQILAVAEPIESAATDPQH